MVRSVLILVMYSTHHRLPILDYCRTCNIIGNHGRKLKIIMKIIKLFEDYSIPHRTEGHKHCQEGWVQIKCPYCSGNPGWHLGYDLANDYFNCWRCGFHSTFKVIKDILQLGVGQTKELIEKYHGKSAKAKKVKSKRPSKLKLPMGIEKFSKRHKKYLEKRNYDPDRIIKMWKLKATGPIGDYKHRIIAPIYFNKKFVSYQGRDITDRSKLKYKACRKDLEVINHKEILYGIDHCKKDVCVLVEGITDVWRLGYGSVATFGIKFKPAQINLLYKRFKKVFVFFDPERQAQLQADKIVDCLSGLGLMSEIIEIDQDIDPADMSQKQANYLMKFLKLL